MRNVDLEINPGEIVAVIGASGAGKTTLLRLILGAALKIEDEKYKPSVEVVEVDVESVAAIIPAEFEPKIDDRSILEQVHDITDDIILGCGGFEQSRNL